MIPPALADWTRKFGPFGLGLVVLYVLLAVAGQWLVPYDPAAQSLLDANQGPTVAHWLGTDHLGRDTLSRLVTGAQTTLGTVALVVLFAMGAGVLIGTVAGYAGGWTDELIMRAVDFVLSVPALIVALTVIGLFGVGYWNMVAALTLAWIPSYARVTRGVVAATVHQPHIESLWVLGASRSRLILLHLLPTAMRSITVYASVDAGTLALAIATLSFLGLGIQPPLAEWGQMFVDAMPYMEASPRQILLPGLALTMTVAGFNYIGERLATLSAPRRLRRRALIARLRQAEERFV